MMPSTHAMNLPGNPLRGEPLDAALRSELDRLREHLKQQHAGLERGSASMRDVAQEAAYRVLDKQDEIEFESPSALRGYLWLTAKRLLIDRWRKKSRRGKFESLDSLASELPAGEPLTIPDGRSDDLLSALRKLSFQDRRVLELAYLHDATVGEIASELGISVPAVRMRLVRARERLRERFGPG